MCSKIRHKGKKMGKYNNTVPVEVCILTEDNDIKGTVHVSEYTNSNRELTDLLNDTGKRFLAVTNAEIIPRNSSAPPRKYDFLEVHMDSIKLVHPVTQIVFKELGKSGMDMARFKELRNKLNQTKPF